MRLYIEPSVLRLGYYYIVKNTTYESNAKFSQHGNIKIIVSLADSNIAQEELDLFYTKLTMHKYGYDLYIPLINNGIFL